MTWDFFGSHLQPKYCPTQEITFCGQLFFLLLFFPCYVRQNMVNYTLKTLELCSVLHMYMFPRAQETLWQSLAPFLIFFGVDLVQCIITWWSRAKIQINWKKYQKNSGKSQTWWLLHKRHLEAWEKVLDQYDTWTP